MGNYYVVRRLASGGMADVFLGKLVGAGGFEKPVAIKRMHPALASNAERAKAFLREAQLCVHLVHPNVVQILDVGLFCGEPFLVMELVDGPDLRSVLGQARRVGQPLTPAEAVYLVASVADALGYAHEALGPDGEPLGIIHRDVTPENVLVSMRGDVKLTDFGIAWTAESNQTGRTDVIGGKLSYLPPELLSGEPLRPAGDIYLAGQLLYELLAQKPLIPHGASPREVFAAMRDHDEKRIAFPAEVPPELERILRRALARDPAARFPTAHELARELRALAARMGWGIGRADLARRMAALFPKRTRLDITGAVGVPVRDDASPAPAPSSRSAQGEDEGELVVLSGVLVADEAPDVGGSATPAPGPRRRLGELLVEAGIIDARQLEEALARHSAAGGRVGDWVARLEFASTAAVLEVVARQLGLGLLSDDAMLEAAPPAEVLERFDRQSALALRAVPIAGRDGAVVVAVADPANAQALERIRQRFAGGRVELRLCSDMALRAAISRLYASRGDAPQPSARSAPSAEARLRRGASAGQRSGRPPPMLPKRGQALTLDDLYPQLASPRPDARPSPPPDASRELEIAQVPAGLPADGQTMLVAVLDGEPSRPDGSTGGAQRPGHDLARPAGIARSTPAPAKATRPLQRHR